MAGPRLLLGVLLVLHFAPRVDAAPRPWTEVRTPHFTILSDAGAGDARAIARKFEQFRGVFDRMTAGAIRTGERPITVVALRNQKAMQEWLPSFWEDPGHFKPAGVFIRGLDRHHIVLQLDATDAYADAARELGIPSNPYQVVFHEYVHALLQSNERLPLWLNEGLAEFYASSRIEANRVLMGQPAALVIWYLRERTLIPIETLLGATRDSDQYRREPGSTQFYSQAWALVHFLRVGPGRERGLLLSEYSKQLDAGADPVAAARTVFGDLGQLQAALSTYISGRFFRQELLPGSTAVDDAGWAVGEPAAATLAAYRARIHVDMNRYADAQATLAPMVATSQLEALAHDAATWLHYRQQQYAEALRAARQAIAAGSVNPLTYYVAGFLVASRLVPGTDGRSLLERSLELDADFAPTLTMLAEMSLNEARPPTEALALAQRAQRAAPRQPAGYAAAARALLRLGRTDEALRTARSGLAVADDDRERSQLQEILRAITALRPSNPAAQKPGT